MTEASAPSNVTYYVALPFIASEDGAVPGQAEECQSSAQAVARAESLSRKAGNAGALAFSRSGDLSTGEFSDATLIRKFGDVPDDLSEL